MLEALFLLVAGPISKWDARPPDENYVSSVSMYDAERCIIDTEGWSIPAVFKQADKPDLVTIVFSNPNGTTAARVDLKQEGADLRVISWKGPKSVRICATPKAG